MPSTPIIIMSMKTIDVGKDCDQYLNDTSEQAMDMDKATEDKLYNDFSHRPTWCDAGLALEQVKQKNAKGFKPALYFRSILQTMLYCLGIIIQRFCYIVLPLGLLILLGWCIGLRHVYIETNIEELWVEKGGRLDIERQYIDRVNNLSNITEKEDLLSSAAGIRFVVVIQTPLAGCHANVLTRADLLSHVEMMVNISRIEFTMFGTNWTLADVCFKPEGLNIKATTSVVMQAKQTMDQLMPCVLITPLDCFWEGSLPLGPHPPVDRLDLMLSSPLPKAMSWKNLDPVLLLNKTEGIAAAIGLAGEIGNIKGMYKRIGITKGYLNRPCIDPFDPDCPKTAPNYRSESSLDFGDVLSGGCDGLATNLMQWSEDLIVGGIHRKAKGSNIAKAEALQSIILISSVDNLWKKYTIGNTVKDEKVETRDWERVWNITAASKVLSEWQRAFSNVVYNSPLNNNLTLRQEYQERFNVESNITNRIVYPESVPPPVVTDRFSFMQKTNGIPGMFHPFGGESMNDMLEYFSRFNFKLIIIGYFLMLIYAAFMLSDCRDGGASSCASVAIAGVLLVTFATVGGLGCATILGINFNAATTNIVPFLTLGLGVDDMFLLVHNYKQMTPIASGNEMGYLLKETGLSVLLTSISNILSFAIGGIIPVPALRSFCWQVAIVLLFNVLCILTIYPAMLSIDLIRRKYNRVDLFCCIKVGRSDQVTPACSATWSTLRFPYPPAGPVELYGCVAPESTAHGSSENSSTDSAGLNPEEQDMVRLQTANNPESDKITSGCKAASPKPPPTFPHSGPAEENKAAATASTNDGNSEDGGTNSIRNSEETEKARRGRPSKMIRNKCQECCGGACLGNFVNNYYAPFLSNKFVKIGVLMFFGILIILGIGGAATIKMGLELTDVVPKNTAPYDFMRAREDYFSFYLFTTIIKEGFDYSANQKLIEQYREEMGNIDYIVKDEGSLGQTYWFPLFKRWVMDYQDELTNAIEAGNITAAGPVCDTSNTNKFLSSHRGLFAWELLVNEKNGTYYENFHDPYIIDANGTIRQSGFYNYLTAWVHQDSILAQFSAVNFKPPIHPEWSYNKDKTCDKIRKEDIRIPPAENIMASSILYFATNLSDTPKTVHLIKQARKVCERFESYGMPNFPFGVPFTFWEQYISLTRHILIAIAVIILCVFLVITILLMNLWTAAIVTLVISMMVLELAGFMGIIGLKINPISGVTLVTAVGIAVEFTVHMALSFVTSLGDRNTRMELTLGHMFAPVLHGGITTLLGILMLAFSHFEFIVRYMFFVLSTLLLLGLLNGLILLPVLLSLIGPPPEVQPVDGSDTLPPPSPQNKRKRDSSTKSPPQNQFPMQPATEQLPNP